MNPPMFNGEMAQFYADQEWESAMSSVPEDMYPILDDLMAEARRRGLVAPDEMMGKEKTT